MNSPLLFAVAAEGSNSEKEGTGNIKSIIPRAKARGLVKNSDFIDGH